MNVVNDLNFEYNEEMKEFTNLEIPTEVIPNEEKIEAIEFNFEIGPELGEMSWDEAITKINDLNATLQTRDKKWRLPTKDEFNRLGKPIVEIMSVEHFSLIEQGNQTDRIGKYLNKSVFSNYAYYWSNDGGEKFAWRWSPYTGECVETNKKAECHVQCVR